MRFVVVYFALLLTQGCIYIPAIDSEPYSEDLLNRVTVNETTRSEIEELFGKPPVSREVGNISIYGVSRRSGILIGWGGGGDLHDFQSVLIVYSGDIVSHVEVLETKYGCYKNGLCLLSGWKYQRRNQDDRMLQSLHSAQVVVSSFRDDDVAAKQFVRSPEFCSLYVYTNSGQAAVFLDNSIVYAINSEAYALFHLSSGEHVIDAHHLPRVAHNKTEISCDRDELIFLELEYSHFWKLHAATNRVSDIEGQEAIMSRRIAVGE